MSTELLCPEAAAYTLTKKDKTFFDENGYLKIEGFFSPDETQLFLEEIERIQHELIAKEIKSIYGIPVYWGVNQAGKRLVHRMPFLSTFSPVLAELIQSPKIQAFCQLLNGNTRTGELEKDGLVLNQYTYNRYSKFKSMGWHTDSLRDIFYFRKVYPMLNIGIHLTASNGTTGSLRVIPGSHRQNIWGMLTRKMYYLNNTEDKNEVEIITKPGDLTIHHGHIWHRVAQPCIKNDEEAVRKVMYLPVLCDSIQLKDEKSKTPFYHTVQKLYR